MSWLQQRFWSGVTVARWQRVLIEIYQPDGYQGRWTVTNGDLGTDVEYVTSCVNRLRSDDRYKDAKLQILEDGTDCVIGVFCGREPPAQPNSGQRLPLEMFEPAE